MRNAAKVQAVALAAMIAVAVVAGAGEAQAAKRISSAAAKRTVSANYGRTLERIPRQLEPAGRRLRNVLDGIQDGWGSGVELARMKLARAQRIR